MKGVIDEDHIPVNKYTFTVVGGGVMMVTSVTGLEEELDTVDLPDRTVASGGRSGPVEIVISIPEHHVVDQIVMEAWFKEAGAGGVSGPVLPTYKKPATLVVESLSTAISRTIGFTDMFPSKRSMSDREMGDNGEMAVVEWTMKASDSDVYPTG